MRDARLFIVLAIALVAVGCARRPAPSYVMIDAASGQPVAMTPYPAMAQQPVAYPPTQPPAVLQYRPPQPVMAQQQPMMAQPPVMAQPPMASEPGRGLFTQQQPVMAQPPVMAQQPPMMAQPPVAQAEPGRGLFTSPRNPFSSGRNYAPAYGGPYVAPPTAAPYGYAAAPAAAPAYALDTGDRLRITVFGQDGISNSYVVDAGGNVTLPLIGTVPARGQGAPQLAQTIAARLRQGYVREPKVTVEVEAYRPFFILGEVTTPGQYPYVPNMTVETAVALAGGFGPRASKGKVEITRNLASQRLHGEVPLSFPLAPGDTVVVKERWF